ncbi:MAG: serine/threonine-protein kinase RsbT [Acidobacteriota bacterium]|jgi:serine/threonine-protein kinase RsbT|nr:serine/threonine-protein kinase RsbT [Acidobacteriota bacterium]
MKTVESAISAVLNGSITGITQRSIFNRMGPMATRPLAELGESDRQAIMKELENSVRLFARSGAPELIAACSRALHGEAPAGGRDAAGASAPAGRTTAKTLEITQEKDIATARLEAWSEAVRIGLSKFTSVKVATAVSELARNIVFYADRGKVELRAVTDASGSRLQIVASDKGPGIEPSRLAQIFDGTYRSTRGMGKGLMAVKKLVDEFHLDTAPGRGTTVTCVFKGER